MFFFSLLQYIDYLQCVDTPMDLRTVKEDLFGGNYEAAADFIKDMRLIFTNSRNYNTNKRSRVSNTFDFNPFLYYFFFFKYLLLFILQKTINIAYYYNSQNRRFKPHLFTRLY